MKTTKLSKVDFPVACQEAKALSLRHPGKLVVVCEMRRLAESRVLNFVVRLDVKAYEVVGGYAYGARAAYRGGEQANGELF